MTQALIANIPGAVERRYKKLPKKLQQEMLIQYNRSFIAALDRLQLKT